MASGKDEENVQSLDFNSVYRRFQTPLRRYLAELVKDAALAEELVQETFIKFFRTQESFDASRSVGAWLKTIARNVFIDWKRSSAAAFSGPAVELELAVVTCDRPTPEALSIMRSVWSQHKRVFRKLSQTQRRILWLRIVRQLSYVEIASTMNISLSAVKSSIHRTRILLEQWQGELVFA